jgi:cyanate permease
MTPKANIEKSSSTATKMLAFSFAIAFLLHLLLFATAPMASLIMEQMELSHTQFGIIFAACMISLVIFRIPWGLISDRIGYLSTFRMALLLSAISAVLRTFASGYPTMLLIQFFLGVGLAAVLPCLSLLVTEWSPKNPGMATGIYVSGFAAGNATALGLTPFLLHVLYWQQVLLLYSGLAVVLCGLWWFFAKSTIKGSLPRHTMNVKEIIKDRYVWVLFFFVMAAMGSYDTLATWMPKVLEMKELTKEAASLLPLGFFVAGPTIGFALDRFHDRKMLVGMLGIIAAISIVGINYAPLPLLMVCLFLAGFTTTGVLTIGLTIPASHERLTASVGSVVGLISSFGNIGPLLMPILFGFLIDVTGAFYASVFCVAALAGVVFILGSRIKE